MRDEYTFGMKQAAALAKALGLAACTAIEFGVAGGNGLVAMEEAALEIERDTGVAFAVVGFDLGSGLPPPTDYRDLPYNWRPGFFRMDQDALRRRLRRAQVLLGDIGDCLPEFIAAATDLGAVPPVGFVAFDLDYYSSTTKALALFEASEALLLPRVHCHFDDIIGDLTEIHCDYVGELLAIREFNDAHGMRKLARINGLSHKLGMVRGWHDMAFVLHAFDHSRYCDYVRGERDWQLSLQQ
jgi:hypothetical protein